MVFTVAETDADVAIFWQRRAGEVEEFVQRAPSFWRELSKHPRGKPRGIDDMISQFGKKPKQASGYQTQRE